jgi:hypothetical protein
MSIKVDVPGIGVVEVEGAASEATLQRLVAAVEKNNKGGASSTGSLADQLKKQTTASKDMTKAAAAFGPQAAAAAEGVKQLEAAADRLIQPLKNLGVTAAAVATKFMTQYADIAADPIKAGRDLINTGIDVVSDFTGSLAGAVPVIGGFLKGLNDAAAAALKAANNAFADQLKKNVDALQAYNKSGISFAGGMHEMQMAATNAGLGIKDFADVVNKNKDTLNKLGLAGGEAAEKLSGGLGAAAKTIGKSGNSLRTEMFKMGVTYEEQGAVMTSFMANMQVSGKLRGMSDREIAEGTREYAKNLKVISDITGKDAQKLMEQARAESMRGALMNKLVGDQKTAFMSANSMLSKAGPEVQAALTQYLSFGKILDPRLAANPAVVKMVETVGRGVQAGAKDINDISTKAMGDAYKDMTTTQSKLNEATSRAAVANVQGAGSAYGDLNDKIMAGIGPLDPEAAKKSTVAAEKMAGAHDKLTESVADVYDTSKKLQVSMENLLNTHLDTYAKNLAAAFDGAAKTIMGVVNGGSKNRTGMSTIQEQQAYWKNAGWKAHAGGGKLAAGETGIVGEAGPELVSGPANVLSNASYEKLMVALDAMKEKKGVRFGENGFEWNVNMQTATPGLMVGSSVDRLATLRDRTSGFEQFKPGDILEEMQKRPEYADMQRAKDKMMEDMGDGPGQSSNTLVEAVKAMHAEMANHMQEMVKASKTSATNLSQIALNTN